MKNSILAAIAAISLLGGGAAAQNAPQALPEAGDIINRYVKTARIDQMLARHSSARAKMRIEVPAQKLSGVVVELRARPNTVVSTSTIAGRPESKTGFFGEHAWTLDAAAGPRLLTGEQLADRKAVASFSHALRDTSTYSQRQTLGIGEFGGERCYRVRLISKSNRESIECFGVDSGLLIATQRTVASSMGPVENLSIYSGYKEFGGVLFATRIEQKNALFTTILTLESVEFDNVRPEELELPPQVRALIKPEE